MCLWGQNIVQTTKQPHACSLNGVSVCVCVCLHTCVLTSGQSGLCCRTPIPPHPSLSRPPDLSFSFSLFCYWVGSYKRQMDSLTPPLCCSPSPTGPKKASHWWNRRITFNYTGIIIRVFLIVKERVNRRVTCFLFAMCADVPSTQPLRFWILAFIGWSLFFSHVPLLPFCHGNPACIVMPLWVLAFFFRLVAGCHRQAMGSSQALQGRAPLRWALECVCATRGHSKWSESCRISVALIAHSQHFIHTQLFWPIEQQKA